MTVDAFASRALRTLTALALLVTLLAGAVGAPAAGVFAAAPDTDPDGDELTVTAASDPARGSVAIDLDGTIETATPDPDLTQSPAATSTSAPASGGSGSGSVRVADDLPDTGAGADVASNQWVFALALAMAAGLIAFALAASPHRREDLETDDR